jgi:hypothetical protein
MKNFLKILTLAFIGFLVISCEKDEDQAVISEISVGAISADKNTVVLNETLADTPEIIFTWVKPTFNLAVVTTQFIEFDKKGNNFKNSRSFGVDNSVKTIAMTHAQLNLIMSEIGLAAEVAGQVEARLKTSVGSANFYSKALDLTATPYKPNPDLAFPKINVPGGYAGAAGYTNWEPANSPNLYSPGKDNKYRGFIYITSLVGEGAQYKFAINQGWTGNKGDDGTLTGKLVADGANLTANIIGTRYINVDWVANTYSSVVANFGVIGDATPTGWNSDTDFVYNPATKTYLINNITLNNSGIFKLRANDDWAMKFQPSTSDQTLASGTAVQSYLNSEGTVTGDPGYKVSQAGNYKIELDLHNSAYYKLTITKL